MIRGRLIVCIASSWDYDPTSKHHLMRILSRDNTILWVNYHGTRRPGFRGADVRAACSALVRCFRGPRAAADSIVQMTPLVLPGASRRALRWLQRRMVCSQVRSAIREIDPNGRMPVQVWSFAPDVPYLCGALDEECFVYYCVDEYREFSDLNAQHIAATENEMLARADLVVTTSEALLESKRRSRPDAVLVPHGVDYAHFASAWRAALDRPQDLAEIPRPILGFFGLIRHWIDVQLIAEAARLRPNYSFVLIGECQADVTVLRRLNNVHLFGRRPYETLPAYCAGFDAGLLPFACNAMTRNVNPIKMHEYLAAGLPVVSTSLPEAMRYAGAIRFGNTPEEFAFACDDVLAEASPCRRATISALVADETWDSRAETLSALVSKATHRGPAASRGLPASSAAFGSLAVAGR